MSISEQLGAVLMAGFLLLASATCFAILFQETAHIKIERMSFEI